MAEPHTLLEIEDGVALFTLNRPQKLNAISQRMFDEDLPQLVSRVEQDGDIRVLIITGAGGNFCSGADVTRMSGERTPSAEEKDQNLDRLLHTLYRLIDVEIPVIAAVDGVAFGGGLSLALCADMVMATPRARFSLVFGRIGLIPDMAAAYTLVRTVGERRAKELSFTARTFLAEEAVQMGIVQSLHEPEALLPAARETAARLTHGSRVALAGAKRLINAASTASQAQMIELERAAQVDCRASEFHREAVRRFLEKAPRLYDWDTMDRSG